MLKSAHRLLACLPWLAVAALPLAAAGWDLPESALAHPPLAAGAPQASEVVFSVRGKQLDAIPVAKSFSATRVEWVHSTDAELIARVRKEIGWFGGSQNSINRLPTPAGMAKDFDGNPIVNPRMKAWNVQWNTTTHPDTQQALRAEVKRYLDQGTDALQIDDPLLQLYAGMLWGGDFNEATLAGFPAWLKKNASPAELARAGLKDFSGSYRDWLRQRAGIRDAADFAKRGAKLPSHPLWLAYLRHTVAEHFAGLRDYMRELRGAPVPLSMNLNFLDSPDESGRHFFLTQYVDYAMSETPASDPLDMQWRAATARALGIGLVASPKHPGERGENRQAIAAFYALGAHPLVPWDVYIGNDTAGKPLRFYGKPEDYADLFRFVRQQRHLFDGLEQTPVVGLVVPVDHFAEERTRQITRLLNDRRIPWAFVPVGGQQRKLPVDVARLGHFRVLVTPNPSTDFQPADWRALRSVKARWTAPEELQDGLLDSLVPLSIAGASEKLSIYPRASRDAAAPRLVVHLVDEALAGSAAAADCKRRLVIRRGTLGEAAVVKASWHTPAGSLDLNPTQNNGETLLSVPECVHWGVLNLELGPAATGRRPSSAARGG